VSPRILSSALIAAIAIAVPAMAQQQPVGPSLAEIARQAEAAAPTTKKAKKSYTNADLGADALPPPAPAAPPTGFVSKTLDKPVSAEELLQRSEQQSQEQLQASIPAEPQWRKRAERIRTQVNEMQARLTKLLSRPKNPNAAMQQRTEQEIVQLRAGFGDVRQSWAALEEEARAAKISLTWIEPAPQFPQ